MGKRRGRHLDGETEGGRQRGTERVNVAIRLAAEIMAEWEGTTD